MVKISPMEFYNFQNAYYNGEWPSQRFGQAFINKFYPASGEETSDIFYKEDSVEAEALIMDRLVDYQ